MPFTLGPASSSSSSVSSLPELLQRAVEWPPAQQPGQPQAPFFVSIHRTSQQRQVGTPRFGIPGRPCWTEADAAAAIGWAVRNNRDVYFCTSSATRFETKTNKNGGQWMQTVRDGNSVHSHKCLFVDVDVKPTSYISYDVARTEFDRIAGVIGLPPASFYIASGGGGFHVYWCLAAPIATTQWQPLANRLANALEANGFKGDMGVIIDAVRILRVPGSYNHKTATPAPVQQIGPSGPDYDVLDIERILDRWPAQRTAARRAPGTAPAKPATAMPAAFQGQRMDPAFASSTASAAALAKAPDRTIEEVAQVCPFVAATLADGGKDHKEPLWKETINLALHVKDGRAVAHRLSSGHAAYVPAGTDAKYEQQFHVKQTRAGGLGWPQCITIRAMGSTACDTCPHFHKAQSPLNHVLQNVIHLMNALPGVPNLPPGYTYDALGRVERIDAAGEVTLVCSYPMSDGEIVVDREGRTTLHFTFVQNSTPFKAAVPTWSVGDKRAFLKHLSEHRMTLEPHERGPMEAFLTAWIKLLEEAGKANDSILSFGWHRDGFVTAETYYTPNGSQTVNVPEEGELRHYRPKGSLDVWSDACRLITTMHRPDHNAILASAFAGPLVPLFSADEALWLAVYSGSGFGKSFTMQVMQTVWGSPSGKQRINATPASMFERMGVMRHYPCVIDDLRIADSKTKETVLQMISGRSRARLDTNVKQRTIREWRTITVSCSNHSLHELITNSGVESSAEIVRVFEYEIGKAPPRTQEQRNAAERLLNKLTENYGHAGERYAAWLGRNRHVAEALLRKVERWLIRRCTEMKVEMDDQSRFLRRTIVAVFAGAIIARYLRLMELTALDLRRLLSFLIRKLIEQRTSDVVAETVLSEETLVDYITRYIHANMRTQMVVIRPDGTLENATLFDGTQQITIERRGSVYTLARDPFQKWMRHHDHNDPRKHSFRHVLRELALHGVTEVRAKLGDFVNAPAIMRTPTVRALRFDANHPAFAGKLT